MNRHLSKPHRKEEEMPAKKPTDPEDWVDMYGEYLFKYACLRLRNPDAAKDVVQETLLAGIKGLDRFDGRVDVKYWLRGILRNKVVDYIRKAVRETPIENIEDFEPSSPFLMKHSGIPTRAGGDWEFDPRRAYSNKEFMEIFHTCLSKLRGPQQQAFALRELEGMKTEEICKLLEIEPNNLWVMLHRARAQLKECLELNWKQS